MLLNILRLHSVRWVACLGLALTLSLPATAQTCVEQFQVFFDYELVVTDIETNLDPQGNPQSYSVSFTTVVTTPSPNGAISFTWQGQEGPNFSLFSTADNLRNIAISATDPTGSFLNKTFVIRPSEGVVPGPMAAFDFTLVGDRLTIDNRSTNPNETTLRHDWLFGPGASPFVFQGDTPPEIQYLSGPGDYCISLTVQERSGAFGEIEEFDQRDRLLVDITVEEDVPKASFDVEVTGLNASFSNTSTHPWQQPMTFTWNFGDGSTSDQFSPSHTYAEPGMYQVTLTALDIDGDSDTASAEVETQSGLVVEAEALEVMTQTEEQNVRIEVANFTTEDLEDFEVLLMYDAEFFMVDDTPAPPVIGFLSRGGTIETNYALQPIKSGDTEITIRARGRQPSTGEIIANDVTLPVYIEPDLELELDSSAIEAVGEEVEFTLTITNNEEFSIEGIRVESLGLSTSDLDVTPESLIAYISGPLDDFGNDPRVVPLTLQPGESVQITWRYTAIMRGILDVQAFVSFDRPMDGGRIMLTTDTSLAIDTASLVLTEVRLQPGKPIPGTFSFLRGKITNNGNFDIADIDFDIEDTEPEIAYYDFLVERTDPEISPRIELLEPGQSRDFIIIVSLETEIGDNRTYNLPLKFSGTAEVDGTPVEVVREEELTGFIDRTEYWFDTADAVLENLLYGLTRIVDGIDTFASETGVGDSTIGRTVAVIEWLQDLGDGLLALDDVATDAGAASVVLEEEATVYVAKIKNYLHSSSFEQKLVDLAELQEGGALAIGDLTVATLDDMTQWMLDVEKANDEGDDREVARLITDATIDLSVSIGGELLVERATARLIEYALTKPLIRSFHRRLLKGLNIPDLDDPVDVIRVFIDRADKAFDDLPTGVLLNPNGALLAGVEGDDLDFMFEVIQENLELGQDVTFFVRPRPATAALWARRGFNAKPLAVKLKSVNNIDYEWLGYSQADEGLIVFREPEDPLGKLADALRNGELDIDDDADLINSVVDRYMTKKAEYENRDEWLSNFNSEKTHTIVREDPNNPGEFIELMVTSPGSKIRRFGEDHITRATIDGNGKLIFSYNGQPVYSDIDLLSVAQGDGVNLPAALHQRILKESGFGFDGQHHATAQTSDFPNAVVARRVADEFLRAHSRGGEPLLIVGPKGMYKGYVESFSLIPENVAESLKDALLSEEDLYGLIVESVTYTPVPVQ